MNAEIVVVAIVIGGKIDVGDKIIRATAGRNDGIRRDGNHFAAGVHQLGEGNFAQSTLESQVARFGNDGEGGGVSDGDNLHIFFAVAAGVGGFEEALNLKFAIIDGHRAFGEKTDRRIIVAIIGKGRRRQIFGIVGAKYERIQARCGRWCGVAQNDDLTNAVDIIAFVAEQEAAFNAGFAVIVGDNGI